MMRKDPL